MRMPAPVWLRIAAVLQGLGALGHTVASASRTAPEERAVYAAMRGFRVNLMGSSRSHWDFYQGYIVATGVNFVILAVLFWQLSNLSRKDPALALPMVVTLLAGAIFSAFAGFNYFFPAPGFMSSLIALCLAAAAFTMYRGADNA